MAAVPNLPCFVGPGKEMLCVLVREEGAFCSESELEGSSSCPLIP